MVRWKHAPSHKADSQECFEINNDTYLFLSQIRLIPLGPALYSHARLLFNCLQGDSMSVINRVPINANNEHDYYEALVERQEKVEYNYNTLRNYTSVSNRVYCSSSVREQGTMDPGNHHR